jgi:hypothetical protein
MSCCVVPPSRRLAAHKYDSRHSGNVPDRDVYPGLVVGAVPLTDAIFTAPAVREGRVYAVDGRGCFLHRRLD